jgi:hypothetical protein
MCSAWTLDNYPRSRFTLYHFGPLILKGHQLRPSPRLYHTNLENTDVSPTGQAVAVILSAVTLCKYTSTKSDCAPLQAASVVEHIYQAGQARGEHEGTLWRMKRHVGGEEGVIGQGSNFMDRAH